MNVRSFLDSALSSALDIGLATCDDVLKHVTPDILATHLPRPLWARLFTACIGAPAVDAQLIVDTLGVPNLCEHMPTPIIWACVADIAQRSLGGMVTATASVPESRPIVTRSQTPPFGTPKPIPLSTPPPPEERKPVASKPPPPPGGGTRIPTPTNTPLANLLAEVELEDSADKPSRTRPSTGRLRQTNANIGRLSTNQRRPQAQASAPSPDSIHLDPTLVGAQVTGSRRGEPDSDLDIETDVNSGRDDWQSALAVEDEQLVDWSSPEEMVTANNDKGEDRIGRKR